MDIFSKDTEEIFNEIKKGNRIILSRTITLIENGNPFGTEILKTAFHETGKSIIIGITGAPGAGKSTLVDKLTTEIRKKGKTVAIIAVDPTSPFTGGAILGDRLRMQKHSIDDGVFIRSMATRGNLGGLASSTDDVITLLDAAGFDYIIVETVGVGQDEIDIVKSAHLSIVVMVPGMGDDIQAIKAGIMEIADIFVINKSDHPGVEKIEQELNFILMLSGKPKEELPEIIKTVATSGKGVDHLFNTVEKRGKELLSSNKYSKYHKELLKDKLVRHMKEKLFEKFRTNVGLNIEEEVSKILNEKKSPYQIAEEKISSFLEKCYGD